MKTKSLFFVAATALMVAGCSQNEVMETNPDANRAIGFGVYTGTQTKGLVTDNSTTDGGTANGLKVSGKGFGILAYQTSGNYSTNGAKGTFMDNVHATWNATGGSGSGGWEYSPLKFWPGNNTDKLSFFAYAPYSTGGANGITLTNATGTTDPSLTFESQTNQKDMIDLVVSTAKKDQQQTTASGKVTFDFKHVLTRVTMKAKTDKSISSNAETKVYITGISLKHTTKLAGEATINMNDATWTLPTLPGEAAKYLSSPYPLTATSSNGVLKLENPAWKGYTTPAVSINETAASLFTADQYLFFIPIDGATGTTSADEVKASITYDIATIPSSGATTAAVSSFTKEVDLGTGIFAQGKAYAFTFTIGLNSIEVDVTDSFNWDTTGGDKDVTVN